MNCWNKILGVHASRILVSFRICICKYIYMCFCVCVCVFVFIQWGHIGILLMMDGFLMMFADTWFGASVPYRVLWRTRVFPLHFCPFKWTQGPCEVSLSSELLIKLRWMKVEIICSGDLLPIERISDHKCLTAAAGTSVKTSPMDLQVAFSISRTCSWKRILYTSSLLNLYISPLCSFWGH